MMLFTQFFFGKVLIRSRLNKKRVEYVFISSRLKRSLHQLRQLQQVKNLMESCQTKNTFLVLYEYKKSNVYHILKVI